MHMTTSPSFTVAASACGMSAMSSTKSGSTFPATRMERASERPSAATISSPAE